MELVGKENLYWTEHVRQKMRQYHLSASRIKRVLRHPVRREVGVAEDTVAGMQLAGSPKHPYEIWVMWTIKKLKTPFSAKASVGQQKSKLKTRIDLSNKKTVVISAWRYPGVSPVHEPPPIPEEVWEVLRKAKR